MVKWDLSKLYKSYDSKEFQNDVLKIDDYILQINAFKERFSSKEKANIIVEEFLKLEIKIQNHIGKVYAFVSLQQTTNTTDQESGKYSVILQKKFTEFTVTSILFTKFLSSLGNIDELLNSSKFLKEHAFYIKEIIKSNKYKLDENTEGLLSKLNQSGSSMWSRLQGVLTSTLEVEFNGEVITLPEIIGKSEDSDPEVRKSAYLAELAAYPKIDKSVAFALNGIKGEVNTMTEKRGYKSALDQALIYSRMNEETLTAMLSSMNDFLPVFRKYLKRKATLLGHNNGLPWFDMYAPMGSSAKEFTIPEAQEYILKNFGTFSPHLKDLAKRAFDGNWIDYLPYKGKVGGAFCANINPISESRILLTLTVHLVML